MRTYLTETLKALEKRREKFEENIAKIKKGEQLLAHDEHIIFEAHMQAMAPNQVSIMAEGDSIYEACQKAAARNNEWNRHVRRRVEVFARIGDFRIAIDPKDAAKAVSEEIGEEILASSFFLDERVTKFPSPMVFEAGDKIPSWWYTTKPTPAKQSTIENGQVPQLWFLPGV